MKSSGYIHGSLLWFETDSLFERLPDAKVAGTELFIIEKARADHAVGGEPEPVTVHAVAPMAIFHDGETSVGQAHFVDEPGFESVFVAKCPY